MPCNYVTDHHNHFLKAKQNGGLYDAIVFLRHLILLINEFISQGRIKF